MATLSDTKIFKQLDLEITLILIVAFIFRFFLLDIRPTHHDEGVFGWFADQVSANGFYRYDPTNYHGPLHYYVLFLFQTLLGRSNFVLRLPDAIISLLSVWWIYLFSPFFGKRTCLISALAMAVSPGITYFGRYPFQESFQVFYTILILWGICGLWYEGTRKYLWTIGLSASCMILTKETYIIHIGCFIIAYFVLKYLEKVYPSFEIRVAKQHWDRRDLVWVFICGIGLIIFFYSGAFLNPKGIAGPLETFQAWYKTGVKGSGHDKPFFYWLRLFWRYEHIALIGMLASLRYVSSSTKWIRYAAIYGIGVFLAYSIIPYKTPWCIINLLWPFYFVFADIVSELSKTKAQIKTRVVCSVLFITSICISCKLNFIDYVNRKEPYVYVHTLPDIKKITEPIFRLVKKNQNEYNLIGLVMRSDEWPLPWIFEDFTMIAYLGSQLKPYKYDADFLFVETKRINEVEEKLQDEYFTDTFKLRDAQDPSKLYLSYKKFKDLFPTRSPDFMPPHGGSIQTK